MKSKFFLNSSIGLLAVGLLSFSVAACGGGGGGDGGTGGTGGAGGAGGSGGSDVVIETIDANASESVSIAVDSSGVPHVSYRDAAGTVKYAVRNAEDDWAVETVTTGAGNDIDASTSLALDSSGNAHIAYFNATDGSAVYAFNTGGSWTEEVIDDTGSVGKFISLALDSTGAPHVAYRDDTNMSLRYAVRTDVDTWDATTTVDDMNDTGRFSSIAVDGTDTPMIAYQGGFNPGSQRFAILNGMTWAVEDVDSSANVGITSSLALDSDGDARIAYHDDTNQTLKYAVRTGADSWTVTVADDEPVSNDMTQGVGEATSMAIDSAGLAHISYLDEVNVDLKYAKENGSSFQALTLDDSFDSVGNFTSIALDASDNAHVAYSNITEDSLLYIAVP